jgi:hypothetical protein
MQLVRGRVKMSPNPSGRALPEHDRFLEQVLGVRRPPASNRPGPSAPASRGAAADSTRRFLERLKTLTPDLKRALATPGPRAEELRRRTAEMQSLAGRKEFAPAFEALDRVQALVEQVLAGGGGLSGKGAAAWRDGKGRADAQLRELCDELRATENAVLADIADRMGQVMSRFRAGLTAALAAFEAAAGDDRRSAYDRAAKIIQEYRDYVAAEKLIAAADTNPLGVTVDVGATLLGALDAVQADIDAAMR